MNNSKLYVGHLVQVIPCKGYGFISPKWNDGEEDSDKNIYCYYASNREKARRCCFIKMLDKSKSFLREEVKNFKGEILWKATDPQKIFFRVAIQATENGYKLMAYDLFDERHLSEEEKAEAEANSVVKPSFADVFTVTENGEEIDEKSIKEEVVEKAPVKEESAVEEKIEETPTTEESTKEATEEETPVKEAKEEAPVAAVEEKPTKELADERKEEISIKEPTEEDEYDSGEDDDIDDDDNDSSYYEELARQNGYDDEIVDCYKPISTKKYDDEVVKDKKSQKKASKDKRAQKAQKAKEEVEDYFNE